MVTRKLGPSHDVLRVENMLVCIKVSYCALWKSYLSVLERVLSILESTCNIINAYIPPTNTYIQWWNGSASNRQVRKSEITFFIGVNELCLFGARTTGIDVSRDCVNKDLRMKALSGNYLLEMVYLSVYLAPNSHFCHMLRTFILKNLHNQSEKRLYSIVTNSFKVTP